MRFLGILRWGVVAVSIATMAFAGYVIAVESTKPTTVEPVRVEAAPVDTAELESPTVTEGDVTMPRHVWEWLHPVVSGGITFGEPQTFEEGDCLEPGWSGTEIPGYKEGRHAVIIRGIGGPIGVIDAEPDSFGAVSLTNDVDWCLNGEDKYGALVFIFDKPVRGVIFQLSSTAADELPWGYCEVGTRYGGPVIWRYYIGPGYYGYTEFPTHMVWGDGVSYESTNNPETGIAACYIWGIADNPQVARIQP